MRAMAEADREWGALIHKLYDRCLLLCRGDCEGPLEAHHLITKGRRHYRTDPRNGVLLCSYHHSYCPKSSAHGRPKMFLEALNIMRPEQWEWYQRCIGVQPEGKPDFVFSIILLRHLNKLITDRNRADIAHALFSQTKGEGEHTDDTGE